MNKEEDFDKEYYISTKNEKNGFIVYTSDSYKFSELDLLNLIKMCIIDKRSRILGRRILLVYEDSTEERKNITRERLKRMGLYNEREKQTTIRKNSKTR